MPTLVCNGLAGTTLIRFDGLGAPSGREIWVPTSGNDIKPPCQASAQFSHKFTMRIRCTATILLGVVGYGFQYLGRCAVYLEKMRIVVDDGDYIIYRVRANVLAFGK